MLTLSETAACEWSGSRCAGSIRWPPGGIASSGFDTYAPEIVPKLFEYTRRVPLQRFGTESEVSSNT